jgi:hypothetical protein
MYDLLHVDKDLRLEAVVSHIGDMISSARKISGMDRAMKPQWADLHLELKA